MLSIEIESLKKIKEKLLHMFGTRIVYMYAFGSRVRGDFNFDSDFDILIVVNKKTPELEEAIVTVITEEELQHNVSFTPIIKDIQAFEMEKKFNSPFYQNIINEGILL
ncbi:MAG: nucleotidyltransferase domain-containing protein [Spirochaetes bacterium]|nr:nucleotidyltransferase domain-containing protein [Spirochaetota bacterium]